MTVCFCCCCVKSSSQTTNRVPRPTNSQSCIATIQKQWLPAGGNLHIWLICSDLASLFKSIVEDQSYD